MLKQTKDLIETRCCCDASLLGYLPADSPLELRQLEDDTFAFDSNHDKEGVAAMLGFVEAETKDISKVSWKKTWKK